MRFLVTGGAGFIGSAVVRHLIADTPHEVVNLDKLTYAGNLDNLADDPRYRFERADICDPSAIRRIFEDHKPDVIMHLAAECHVDRSIDGPGTFLTRSRASRCRSTAPAPTYTTGSTSRITPAPWSRLPRAA